MKPFKKYKLFVVLLVCLTIFYGCQKLLTEKDYSELAPDNFLNTENGISSVLANAYTRASNMGGNSVYQAIASELFTTEQYFQTGGGDNAPSIVLLNFSWDAGTSAQVFVYNNWGAMWQAIRNANIVLESADNVLGKSQDWQEEIKAEARFVRVYAYYKLWNQFGEMVIRRSSGGEMELPRASREEFNDFMQSELLDIIPVLPDPGKELAYGRANKGAAMALLTLWYLNTYQWQKCADAARDLINTHFYSLTKTYNEMFELENKKNSEFIWVQPSLTNQNDAHNAFLAVVLPIGFQQTLEYKYPFTDQNWSNFASQFRLRDSFVNSFDPDDERDDRFLKKYTNKSGAVIDLAGGHDDNVRGIKFPPDPAAVGAFHGNDFPYIRYAEIILARAEALNNLSGPNQESIDLINQIRSRAGINPITLGNYGSKDELNDEILEERGHEFWYEGKRRRDLIRMGKFIEFAKQRGISNAIARDTLFPLPQSAIDANSRLVQNAGY